MGKRKILTIYQMMKKCKIWQTMVKNMGCGENEDKTHTNIKKSISENVTVKELIKNDQDNL